MTSLYFNPPTHTGWDAALGALNAGVMNAPAAVGDAVKLKSDSNTIRTEAELDIRQRRETAEKEGKALEAYGTTDPERQVAFREAEIIANRFGNALGLSEGNAEGTYQNGKITINKNTNNPVMEVLFHELTHHLETKKDYASFAKYALDYIANDMGADVQTLKENIIKDYAKGGITLDDQGAERELVAKFTESKLFHDEAAVNRLYNTDPSLFQRIYYWIQDSVKKLTGTQEEKRLMEEQNLFQKVMKSGQAAENAQIENLYAGENSKGADLKALDMARQLDERGVSGEEIRQQTGWFKGMDGKWRYEMEDNGMKTDTTGAYYRNTDIDKDNSYTKDELSNNTDFERFIPENNDEESSIKDQIIKGAELVADMESVATINRPITGIRSDFEKKKYAWGVLKDKLGKIIRRGFGTIDIGKKAVDKSTSYIRSEADLLAYEAIPDVIEKGRIVEGHRKHKNNDFPTLTIAAPVTINEKDGIMAVVIKNTGANRYKAHRVLTPSGTILELNENEELVRPDNPKLNSNDPITNSSKEDIASNDKDVKPLASPGAEDSQKSYGRKLDDLVKPLASPGTDQSVDTDRKYMRAVEFGDVETAQRLVNDAAERNGYTEDSGYQGTSAFNGSAPSDEGYYSSREEKLQAWENGDYISIHPPTRGGTFTYVLPLNVHLFQSTHPHGVGQRGLRAFEKAQYFNPPTHTGWDLLTQPLP